MPLTPIFKAAPKAHLGSLAFPETPGEFGEQCAIRKGREGSEGVR